MNLTRPFEFQEELRVDIIGIITEADRQYEEMLAWNVVDRKFSRIHRCFWPDDGQVLCSENFN